MHSSSWEPIPAGPGPQEEHSHLSASSTSSSRPRRPRRVMYPASQSRRPLQKEGSDLACRWLLLLSLLVLLQIYSEEANTCTESQNQRPESRTCPEEGDEHLGEANRCKESWRHQAADRATEHQLQGVVA